MMDAATIVVHALDSERNTLFVENCTEERLLSLIPEISTILHFGLYSGCYFFEHFMLGDYRRLGGIVMLRKNQKITSKKCEGMDKNLWDQIHKGELKGKTEVRLTAEGPRLFIVNPPTSSNTSQTQGRIFRTSSNPMFAASPTPISLPHPNTRDDIPTESSAGKVTTSKNKQFLCHIKRLDESIEDTRLERARVFPIPVNSPLLTSSSTTPSKTSQVVRFPTVRHELPHGSRIEVNQRQTCHPAVSIPEKLSTSKTIQVKIQTVNEFDKTPSNERIFPRIPIPSQLLLCPPSKSSSTTGNTRTLNIQESCDFTPGKKSFSIDHNPSTESAKQVLIKRNQPPDPQHPAVYYPNKKSRLQNGGDIDNEKEKTESKVLNNFLRSLKLPTKTPLRQRRGIKFSGRDIIRNVKKNLEVLKTKLGDAAKHTIFSNTTVLTATLTGLSESTVKRCNGSVRDVYRKFISRAERRKRAGDRALDEDKALLRAHLDECWRIEKTVTLSYLVEWCDDNWENPVKKTCLGDILHSMGLCFKKKSGNPIIEERKDLIAWRKRYLKRKDELLTPEDGTETYFGFFDETWCYSGMVSERGWQYQSNMYQRVRCGNFNEPRSGPIKGRNKGKRGIVLSVLTQDGILNDSIDIIISGVNESDQAADYHKDMNADNYKKYLEKVVPQLARAAQLYGMRPVLVIDNAPYHNRPLVKVPRKSDKKATISAFLESHGMTVDKKWNKNQLLVVFENFLSRNGGRRALTVYEMDEWAQREHGVEILRLPPYHCIFNPIELLWAQLKGFLRANGKTTDTIQQVRERAIQWLETFSPEEAQKLIFHVEEIEEEIRSKIATV